MIAGSIWLIAMVLVVLAYRKARIGRGSVNVGAAGAGAVYDMLNEDKRKAVEIVVEGRAEAQDPEDRDGNLPGLEHRNSENRIFAESRDALAKTLPPAELELARQRATERATRAKRPDF